MNESLSRDIHRRNQKIFGGCLLLMGAAFVPAFVFHCVPLALRVGGVSLFCGGLLGASLAGVTRTTRTGAIYLLLGVALLAFLPVFHDYPPAGAFDLTLPKKAPEIFQNYFDFLRWSLFLLGVLPPFARFGHHAPD